MNARRCLADLAARGVLVAPDGDLLDIDAPMGVLTDADRAALREHKPIMLELLGAPCLDCGGSLPVGHLYRCQPCTVAAWWHVYQTAPPTRENVTHADG
jgi:hypothetical protein